jgi:hypothetical protein
MAAYFFFVVHRDERTAQPSARAEPSAIVTSNDIADKVA